MAPTESFLNISSPPEVIQFPYANLIDEITYDIIFFLSIVGILGNGVSIAILRQHDIAQSSNIFLLVLSVNDLVFCLTQCLKRIKNLFAYFPGYLNYPALLSAHSILRISSVSLGPVLFVLSVVVTALIAIERLVAVCFPFHVGRVFTPKKVKYMIVSIYVFFFVLTSPIFLRSTLVWEFSEVYNATKAVEKFSAIYVENRSLIDTYLVLVIGNICTIVLLATIFISSVFIAVKLIRRKFQNLSSSKDTAKERINKNKVIKMLLTLCSITFFSVLTTSVAESLMTDFTDEQYYGQLGVSLRLIDYLLYQMSPSTNFIIYISMSKKFRSEYKKMFRCFNIV